MNHKIATPLKPSNWGMLVLLVALKLLHNSQTYDYMVKIHEESSRQNIK